MSEINDGGPAFPFEESTGDGITSVSLGMSLRDYFAGQVICGLLANQSMGIKDRKKRAEFAYLQAEALIAEIEVRRESDHTPQTMSPTGN